MYDIEFICGCRPKQKDAAAQFMSRITSYSGLRLKQKETGPQFMPGIENFPGLQSKTKVTGTTSKGPKFSFLLVCR